MTKLEFKNIKFRKEKDVVKAYFLKIYSFEISKEDLENIGSFKIVDGVLEIDCSEKRAINKFNQILSKGFDNLICNLNKIKTVYIHKNSGIPLIGAGVFGIIDRNTNCIEVKPLTTCNLDCIYCSVNAGLTSKKNRDYIIEKDYLIEEFNKLVKIKEKDLEVHIGPQGEPLLYEPLVGLVKDLKANPKVKIITMDTNATLLTEKLIDNLADAGMTRLNISLNALTKDKCSELAGTNYNLNHVLKMITYANQKMDVIIAPVLIPGMNDDQVQGLIEKSKELNSDSPKIGIQNFLNYKKGRNPVKQRNWEEFFKILEEHEKNNDVKLKLCKEDFSIESDSKLDKPLKKKQTIKATVVCEGPLKGEKICVSQSRSIIVEKVAEAKINSEIKILLIRDKHNIYRGVKA